MIEERPARSLRYALAATFALTGGYACTISIDSDPDGDGGAAASGGTGTAGVAGSGGTSTAGAAGTTGGAAGSSGGTAGTAGVAGSAGASGAAGAAGAGGAGGSAGASGSAGTAGAGGSAGASGSAGTAGAGMDASAGSGGTMDGGAGMSGSAGTAGAGTDASAGSGGTTDGCAGSSGSGGSGGATADAAADAGNPLLCSFGDGAVLPPGSDGGPYAEQCMSNDAGAGASCGPKWFSVEWDQTADLTCDAFCATLPGGPWQCSDQCDTNAHFWVGSGPTFCDPIPLGSEFWHYEIYTDGQFIDRSDTSSCFCGASTATREYEFYGSANMHKNYSRSCCCEPAPCAADCTQCAPDPGSAFGSCQSQCPCPSGEYCSSLGNCCPLPQQIACIDLPGHVEEMQIVGQLLYAVSFQNGLYVLDISDPASPVEVGSLDLPDNNTDLAVDGTTAYVIKQAAPFSGGTNVFIVDVTNPAAPSLIGSVGEPSGTTEDWNGVAAQGGTLYVTRRGGMQIFDVSSPPFPVAQGFWPTPGWNGNSSTDVAIIGNVAHVAVIFYSLYQIDVTNPSAPVELSGGVVGSDYDPVKIEVVDGKPFVASRGGTGGPLGYRHTESANEGFDGSFKSVAVSAEAVYLVGDLPSSKLTVIDRFASPAVKLAKYDIQGNDIEVSGEHLFVAQGDQGIAVYRHTVCR